mgnify:FL=1
MPFTPFHFGPCAAITFLLKERIDLPIFILANIVIDIEPLAVMTLNLSYPLHGYAHCFLGATFIGALWGIVGFKGKTIIHRAMQWMGLNYRTTMKTAIISGIGGALSHIILDAPIYADIKPFYPLSSNPFYGMVSDIKMYLFCGILCITTVPLYIKARRNEKKASLE